MVGGTAPNIVGAELGSVVARNDNNLPWPEFVAAVREALVTPGILSRFEEDRAKNCIILYKS